ncbi:MAG: hypothetical protein CXR31_15740 [Geobacter sp.]|nr:MAG: hypothetical protein CXR31_15740 [Geobacter sp.]
MIKKLIIILTVLFPTSVLATSGEDFTEVLGVRITRDITLTDVQKKLGKAQMVETGDAGEYKAAICYYSPKCQTHIEFWSNELGGPEHDLVGFTLSKSKEGLSVCSELAIDDCATVKVPKGLKLGMRLEEYKGIVGGDIETEGSFYQKAFERRQPMTEAERTKMLKSYPDLSPEYLFWDIVVFVRGAFRYGVLEILEVSKTETN